MNARRRLRCTALLVITAALLMLPSARAATTILRPFTGGTTGGKPYGSLTLSGSTLYGMASAGGFNGFGTAFSINTDGTGFVRLHSFAGGASDGSEPHGSLTLSGSTLYGMTRLGGSGNAGTVFSMNTDGTGFALLHSLTDASGGSYPVGSLTLANSKLYGMTLGSGGSHDQLFSMNTDGTGFGLLHDFTGQANDGGNPSGSLTLSGSTLYGTTISGGASNIGTIFRINTDGTGFGLLHSFNVFTGDGGAPYGSLTLSGLKLYGTTNHGTGNSSLGTVFSMNADGTGFQSLHAFTGGTLDGRYPYGSVTLSGSKLYGMTSEGGSTNTGTLFSINTDGTGYAVLENFGVTPADGANPAGDLTLSGGGSMLYGMTVQGGVNSAGVIFSKAIVPEPSAALLLAAGAGLLLRRRR